MPRPTSAHPTEVEMQILRILWDLGPSPVREIHKRLEAAKGTNYSTTVKMLAVMLQKGLVKRDEEAQPHVYRPALTRAKTGKRMLDDLIEKVYDGSAMSPGVAGTVFGKGHEGRIGRGSPHARPNGGQIAMLAIPDTIGLGGSNRLGVGPFAVAICARGAGGDWAATGVAATLGHHSVRGIAGRHVRDGRRAGRDLVFAMVCRCARGGGHASPGRKARRYSRVATCFAIATPGRHDGEGGRCLRNHLRNWRRICRRSLSVRSRRRLARLHRGPECRDAFNRGCPRSCWSGLPGSWLAAFRPLLSWYTVRRLRTVGVSPVADAVHGVLERTAKRLGLDRAVEMLQSTLVKTPVVVGYLRPAVLLPLCVVTGLPETQLELILAHELAHIRRHDYLVNLLQTLVETLFFYHPAVWWLSRQVRNERENCCDDVAMATVGQSCRVRPRPAGHRRVAGHINRAFSGGRGRIAPGSRCGESPGVSRHRGLREAGASYVEPCSRSRYSSP